MGHLGATVHENVLNVTHSILVGPILGRELARVPERGVGANGEQQRDHLRKAKNGCDKQGRPTIVPPLTIDVGPVLDEELNEGGLLLHDIIISLIDAQ